MAVTVTVAVAVGGVRAPGLIPAVPIALQVELLRASERGGDAPLHLVCSWDLESSGFLTPCLPVAPSSLAMVG